MLCRYRCDSCGGWHLLSDVPTDELDGLHLAFMFDPPEPFGAWLWHILVQLEVARRQGRKPTIIW